jgi:hypothetical protein
MDPAVDYTKLTLDEVRAGLAGVADDAQATFAGLDAQQVNWRPDGARWSVAQCFEHLCAANRLMIQQAEAALDQSRTRTVWQRLPVLPGVFVRMLIRSQSPEAAWRFKAPADAQPSASDIAPDILRRFIEQNRAAVALVQRLDEPRAAREIMTSPFASMITYSVLDGWRLMLTHDRRHLEQARRVTQSRGFPA